ncbi:hypothetical protein G647_09568 [Cladophialophora carrionii CBS 160.54]|uniref:Histone deacetylase complex subunit SAP30 Sin3 binding domain-containing protein n=1 Tax=Cladophialophora carrionii CBS 160.54 TaxID=1279043 RepID=V9DM36_9EURO|nr:uncharacterized protein G647_09568 [Cladophialophora carrionii CBS 160.54]ETI27378.1 hypothetical protein G647_09568 [Cladophialophora carrionii CBS 160.54]
MPPARARNVDDSRSETSSTITNQKEKSALGPTSGSGVSKGKKSVPGGHNGASVGSKATVTGNGSTAAPAAAPPAVEADKDPSLPRTEWDTMPVAVLRTYRIAHRLPVPAAFNQPHAELAYKSSDVGQRAPSVVYYRRKLHEQHLQRRRARQTQQQQQQQQQTNGTGKTHGSKSKEKGKLKDTSMTDGSSNTSLAIAQSIEPPDPGHPASERDASSVSSGPWTYLGPNQPVSNLAAAVRKHFNAQQLIGGEADTIARFIYVVQQNGSSRQVRTEGSEGDGSGYWMGGNGREQRRVDGPGGEVGFRLRFRP